MVFAVRGGASRLLLGLALAVGATGWAGLARAESGIAAEPRLFRAKLRLEPTEAQLDKVPSFAAAWRLPTRLAANLATTLKTQGFATAVIEEMVARLELDPGSGEGTIRADAGLLELMTEDERGHWRSLLALHGTNRACRWPMGFRQEMLERLERDPAWSELVARVRKFGMSSGDRVLFWDAFLLAGETLSGDARRDLWREALGAETLFVKLEQEAGADAGASVESDAAYWQVQGRYRAIEPFLNAVRGVEGHDRIDLAHLLPRLARSLVYTFPPDLGSVADPAVENAVLATQFVAETRDARAALGKGFSAWLAGECVPVTDESRQFGDLLVFEDPGRTPWPFAMVYLADGVVFGRQPSLFGPWSFLEESEVRAINPRLEAGGRRYRRKSAVLPPGAPGFVVTAMPQAFRKQPGLRPLPGGPWGRLWCYDVALAPPGDMLEAMPDRLTRPSWTFRGISGREIVTRLEAMDLDGDTLARLLELFRGARATASGLLTVHPSLEMVLDTPREVRAWLFPHLVYGVGGDDYAVRTVVQSSLPPEQWFDASVLPGRARDAVLRLVYPRGGGFALSDYGALFQLFPERSERLTVLRAVLRSPALVVLLERPAPEEVPHIARYWSLDPQKGIAGLLESFAGGEGGARFLDIMHLLPPLPREYLNLYHLKEGNNPTPSCYWTAFNFTADAPDPRFLVVPYGSGGEARVVAEELQERYERVEAAERMGDVLVYRRKNDPHGGFVHACTFVAADIVFTRNGHGLASPWCLARMSDVDAVYLNEDIERVVFRRR